MNIKKYNTLFLLAALCATTHLSYAANPHWTHEEQADWGALENTDTTATVPSLYPFAECGLGQKQSPIAITTQTANAATNNQIMPFYVSTPLSVINNGHTIQVNTPITVNANAFYIGKEKHELLQYHVHAPSEHTLNGKTYPLEIHFVHSTPSGKFAVLGVLVREGLVANAEFQKILDYASAVVGTTNTPANVTINPMELLPQNRRFYTYSGSLTTPPCTEGINWYVLNHSIVLSKAQIAAFKVLYSDNVRAVQNTNGRIVETLPLPTPLSP